jgi:PAS domain S-box-containing protein
MFAFDRLGQQFRHGRTTAGSTQSEAVDHLMSTDDEFDDKPVVDRRQSRPSDESPLTTLARLPALRVLSELPVPVLAVTRDGEIVFANNAFATMLGYDETAVLSLSFQDIFETAVQAESAVSVIHEHANQLVGLSHADGVVVRAVMSRSALQRADDQVALITFQDLTEQLWLEGC